MNDFYLEPIPEWIYQNRKFLRRPTRARVIARWLELIGISIAATLSFACAYLLTLQACSVQF